MTIYPMFAICRICGWRSETQPTPAGADAFAYRHQNETGHQTPALHAEGFPLPAGYPTDH